MNMIRFDVWVALYCAAVILTQVLGSKSISLVGSAIVGSVSLLLLPFTFAVIAAVYEVYGEERALGLVVIGAAATCATAVVSIVCARLSPASTFVIFDGAYRTTIASSSVFAATSMGSFAVSQLLEVVWLRRISRWKYHQTLAMRIVYASAVGLLVDTSVFALVDQLRVQAYAGRGIDGFMVQLIGYWLIRVAAASAGIPLAYAGVRWLRRDIVKSAAV